LPVCKKTLGICKNSNRKENRKRVRALLWRRMQTLNLMNDAKRLLKIAAKSNIPVLICGESGTGKEVAARILHAESGRATGPFIAVNCGALNSGLMESLFEGSRRGAFTGSTSDQLGFVRAADKGTLFLDEIGELPLESQTRFLRILQERAVTPLGSQSTIPVDFRLVCATHRNLEQAVRAGLFREDLYFRLNVFPVRLPPLRHRQSEFASLVQELWHELGNSSLEENDVNELASFPWPGNVRQLKNVLCRYRLLEPYGTKLSMILAEETWNFKMGKVTSVCEQNGGYKIRSNAPCLDKIVTALEAHQYNKTHAAQSLGISRGCLCYQLRKRDS